MPATELLFLGADHYMPGVGDDTVSMVLNQTMLVDTGWNSTLRMQALGIDPMALDELLFTHLHHDHYLGLPQLLFHRLVRSQNNPDARPLLIVGPADDLDRIVQLALDFLQTRRLGRRIALELRPLQPGDSLTTERYDLTTCSTIHPVQGLCYRIHDRETGATLGLTGDTAFHEPIIDHVRGVDLLVHDTSYGPNSARAAANNHGHSGAPEAAEIAQRAGVGRLALVHSTARNRAKAVTTAAEVFPNVFWPEPGQTIQVEPRR